MITIEVEPVTVEVRALPPDLFDRCVLLSPVPDLAPGSDPIDGDGITTPVAPGVTYELLPVLEVIDTSPSRIIGCINDTSPNAASRLDWEFPSAIEEDGVIDRSTGDIWVLRGGVWVNVGPTPGPTIVVASAIPPWDETLIVLGRTRTRLSLAKINYAFELETIFDPVTTKTKVVVQPTTGINILVAGASQVSIEARPPLISVGIIAIPTVLQAVEYIGNGTARTISGLVIKPDIAWLKSSQPGVFSRHGIFDVARGPTKYFRPETTATELVDANSLTAFGEDSFDLGTSNDFNFTGRAFLAWVFGGLGAVTTNTDGTLTTQVRASEVFSIITYTGATGTRTIGHGLPGAPDFVMVKNLGASVAVATGGPVIGNGQRMLMNSTANRLTTVDSISSTSSSTISLPDSSFLFNNNQNNYISYAFREVPGLSRIGAYVGDGGVGGSGRLLDFGFEPEFVLIKSRDAASGITDSGWIIISRATADGRRWVYANSETVPAAAAGAFYGLESNGIRLFGDRLNHNGSTYLYIAFSVRRTRAVRIGAADISVSAAPGPQVATGASVAVPAAEIGIAAAPGPAVPRFATLVEAGSMEIEIDGLPPAVSIGQAIIVPSVAISIAANPPFEPPIATGGTESTLSIGNVDYRVHTFTSVGSSTLTVIKGGEFEYLVVAGGGGGGGTFEGGGGGAGGYLSGTTLLTTDSYAITVGAGGTGQSSGSPPTSGGNSSLGGVVSATGGGRGSSSQPLTTPATGGSGGGGTHLALTGATGTAGQGNAGGNGSSSPLSGGGGGGAGSTGTNAATGIAAPAGGTGLANSISGTSITYAAGGAGRNRNNPANGSNAAANTGNGGNAGSSGGGTGTGGNGGSGIVIVRYAISQPTVAVPAPSAAISIAAAPGPIVPRLELLVDAENAEITVNALAPVVAIGSAAFAPSAAISIAGIRPGLVGVQIEYFANFAAQVYGPLREFYVDWWAD